MIIFSLIKSAKNLLEVMILSVNKVDQGRCPIGVLVAWSYCIENN